MVITEAENFLFALLKSGIYGEDIDFSPFSTLKEGLWRQVFDIASRQGVVSIAGEALSSAPKELLPPKALLLEWIGQIAMQENIYSLQRKRIRELRELWGKAGIKCVELKGESVGRWYYKPSSRYSCDFDCYLSDYDKGNNIIEHQGITVNKDFYKNSSFYWKELYVENHQFCTPVRGKKEMKQLERRLQQLLADYPEFPNPDFNALFLMEHAWGHFFEHAISMKHVCDWAVFRRACGSDVDWESYEQVAKDCGFWKFSQAFSHIADLLDGLISEEQLSDEEQKLLQSILQTERHGSLNDGWSTRFNLVNGYYKHRWKYRAFSNHRMMSSLCRSIFAYCFDRHPHI